MNSLLGSNSEIVLYAGYLLAGIATALFTRMLTKEQESRMAQENLDEQRDRESSNPLVKFARPFLSQYFVPMIRGKDQWEKIRLKVKRKIIAAGLKEEFTPDEFIAFKLFNIIFFPIAAGFLNAFGLVDLSMPVIFAMGIVGWFYPDIWVRGRITARQKEIRKSLPFIVDLLALSTEAGLDFVGAIGKVVEKAAPGPLVQEFEQFLREIKIGSSRQEALKEMAVRINMQEFNSFISILVSADQMGAPIGRTLRQQSEQIRADRFLRAEKEGAKASTKIMIPTVVIIMPAVFLMVIGPFILSIFSGTGG